MQDAMLSFSVVLTVILEMVASCLSRRRCVSGQWAAALGLALPSGFGWGAIGGHRRSPAFVERRVLVSARVGLLLLEGALTLSGWLMLLTTV